MHQFETLSILLCVLTGLNGCRHSSEKRMQIGKTLEEIQNHKSLKNFTIEASTVSLLNWREARFEHGSISDSAFRDLIATGSNWQNVVLKNNKFEGARLAGTHFISSRISHCSFENADLTSSVFENVSLQEVNFRGANLSEAIFVLTDLAGSKFNGKTKLPFTIETAKSIGMLFDEE